MVIQKDFHTSLGNKILVEPIEELPEGVELDEEVVYIPQEFYGVSDFGTIIFTKDEDTFIVEYWQKWEEDEVVDHHIDYYKIHEPKIINKTA